MTLEDNKLTKLLLSSWFTNFVVAATICAAILPFIIWGQDSIVTIHDFLDAHSAWLTALKQADAFWGWDVPTTFLNGLSSNYLYSFDFLSLLNSILPIFTAWLVGVVFSIGAGFISMYYLLRCVIPQPDANNLLKLVAVAFAILPAAYYFNPGMALLPLVLCAFIKLMDRTTPDAPKWRWVLFLTVYPFFCGFVITGIFVLGILLLMNLYWVMKEKKLSTPLMVAFAGCLLVTVLVNLKLLYIMFISDTLLNRSSFALTHNSVIRGFLKEFVQGHYHASTHQQRLIFPIVMCVAGYLNWRWLRKKGQQPVLINVVLLLIAVCALAAGLYESHILDKLVAAIIPILSGFNWGRLSFFARPLWYLLFAASLLPLLSTRRLKWLAPILVIVQIALIYVIPSVYNDASKTVLRHTLYNQETHSYASWIPRFITEDMQLGITYEEFFDEKLFTDIKESIDYAGEKAAAVGYHPSVLSYNGFSTIDGYISAYPAEYMRTFRTLIEPELIYNPEAEEYFDSWGGRLYLYNKELDYVPSRDKDCAPITLRIDADAFRKLGGKYILSRASIINDAELGLQYINTFEHEDSLYKIYLYEMI